MCEYWDEVSLRILYLVYCYFRYCALSFSNPHVSGTRVSWFPILVWGRSLVALLLSLSRGGGSRGSLSSSFYVTRDINKYFTFYEYFIYFTDGVVGYSLDPPS